MIAGPSEFHEVPGDRRNVLLEPSVKHLARQRASSIDKTSDLNQRRTDNVQHDFNFQLPSCPCAADVGR